jgi:hypothetical protein
MNAGCEPARAAARLTRAMVSALLDPARVREANVSVPFELWVMAG